MTVTAPNGGGSVARGQALSIEWAYAGSVGTSVRIELLRDGAVVATPSTSRTVGSGGRGSFSWPVPATLSAALTAVRLRRQLRA